MRLSGGAEPSEEQVGVMVRQVVAHHLPTCHLMLMTTSPHSPVFAAIRRHMRSGVAVVVSSPDQHHHHIEEALFGDSALACRGLILHLHEGSNNDTDALRMLERTGLWKRPETKVLVVGGSARVKGVLLHSSLRNTVHGVYLALHQDPAASIAPGEAAIRRSLPYSAVSQEVSVYRRCLYCSGGDAGVSFVHRWNISLLAGRQNYTKIASLHPYLLNEMSLHSLPRTAESLRDMNGHKFRVTTLPNFPYTDYRRESGEPGAAVTPLDSLNGRFLDTFAAFFNFTYVMRENPTRSFGYLGADGQYSGMVGELQREEVELCMILAPTAARFEVIDYLRLEPADTLVILSLKPTLLPAHLSLLRPFTTSLWIALVACMVAWGLVLWLLQRAWRLLTQDFDITLPTALTYSWGALLEKPPDDPSINTSGQVLVGWWLVFCLIISTGFKSSLIAHLTVQGRSRTLESLQDLVEADSWRWGSEKNLFNGAPVDFFRKQKSPVMKKIYGEMELLDLEAVMNKILDGRFSLIIFKKFIQILIASKYTDSYGQTPFYMSREEFNVLACLGWGIRLGAPYLSEFVRVHAHLEDAGVVPLWTEEVIARRVKENREAARLDQDTGQGFSAQEDENEVVLGLDHLQGAFYLLFLGSCVAMVTLLLEIFLPP
ncbi:glutamate [NMDA] receptor subunit 1-like [Portunus trituberculatus]|uniref:glutamate [NMDA] receptor subunit 1-like n=1 Tax=Portunus trituberculatus TaxID=210409 RepID=UPI001E1CED5A|nr:glutamate [NMDA] receptor subunit 1-like [Portunus trituberculatus]